MRGHYLFREAKLEKNCELRGTGNDQGQISVHIFEVKWRLLCLLSVKYFYTRPHFARPFLEAFLKALKFKNFKVILSTLKILLVYCKWLVLFMSTICSG